MQEPQVQSDSRMSRKAWRALSSSDCAALQRIVFARSKASKIALACLVSIAMLAGAGTVMQPLNGGLSCPLVIMMLLGIGGVLLVHQSPILTSSAGADALLAACLVCPDQKHCLRCGYSREGLEPSATCPECGHAPFVARNVEEAKLQLVRSRYSARTLDVADRRSALQLYRSLTRAQRRRARRTFMKHSKDAGLSRAIIIGVTLAAMPLVIAFMFYLLPDGAWSSGDARQPASNTALNLAAIAFVLTGLFILIFMRRVALRRLWRRSPTQFIRAINRTLDRSCVICDAERERDDASPCDWCGISPPKTFLPPDAIDANEFAERIVE